MTMASVAVGPASLAACPPNMLGPKRYQLNSPNSSAPPKGYETLSKSKKSWSVRLGLSRASQHSSRQEASSHGSCSGWGTVSGGSVLAQQMIYAEPWQLYGTVRATSSRPLHVAAQQLAYRQPHAAATPVLLVCSCPDFLSGTTRDLGSNCRKCGGHRLVGLPIGGTCRMPTTTVRARPSLAGMLKPTVDDPYDLMRRSRLVEPRSRARSISPLRQASQRNARSQSVVRCTPIKAAEHRSGLKVATVEPMSRSEWFDCSPSSQGCAPTSDRLTRDDCSNQLLSEAKEIDWSSKNSSQEQMLFRSPPGRVVRMPNNPSNGGSGNSSSNKSRSWQSPSKLHEEETSSTTTSIASSDSRKSILECDVNPYLLLKNKQQQHHLLLRHHQQRHSSARDEKDDNNDDNEDEDEDEDEDDDDDDDDDELSDDLSDNALERELQPASHKSSSLSLFDPSKVKSIERMPNRSSVAAIGGQRIRVFNEPREPSDEDETPAVPAAAVVPQQQSSITRIPIPKISPKRPPRRLKEAKNALKSILKRADKSFFIEPKRKTVLFNVDNVILAPEKPPDICLSPQRKTSKSSVPLVKDSSCTSDAKSNEVESVVSESPIVPEEVQERPHRFITIPNIKSLKQTTPQQQHDRPQRQLSEAKIVPRVKSIAPIDKIKIDKFVPSKKQQLQDQHQQQNRLTQETKAIRLTDKDEDVQINNSKPRLESKDDKSESKSKVVPKQVNAVAEPDLEELPIIKAIAVDEKDMIDKCDEVSALATAKLMQQPASTTTTTTTGATCLMRSQSERSTARPETSAADVNFVDTMRLSLCRRAKDEDAMSSVETNKQSTNLEEIGRRRIADKREVKLAEPNVIKDDSEEKSPKVRDVAKVEHEKSAASKTANVIRPSEPEGGHKKKEEGDLFKGMRPTSWSPPPAHAKKIQQLNRNSANVCKITVSPNVAPAPLMVHRLQVGSNTTTPLTGGSHGTSILINGEQQQQSRPSETTISDNKVTISVTSENALCNPTVISINNNNIPSEICAKIQTSTDQKRTLVILDNYRSNIIIGGDQQQHQLKEQQRQQKEKVKVQETIIKEGKTQEVKSCPIEIKAAAKNKEIDDSHLDSSPRWNQIVDSSRCSSNSKEELISKLLEDSLRKARENGEILDESSGEAILKILKQSLLKSCESSRESDPSYFRPSTLDHAGVLDVDVIGTNMFLEENAYEVIKEPIYEEIPDEPPPLPLSPPPTEDFLKNRIFFADDYKDTFRDLNNSGLDRSIEKYYKPLNTNANQFLECSYLSKSLNKSFNNTSNSSMTSKDNLSSKFELLNFIMDSNERTRAGNVAMDQEEDDQDEDEEEEEEEEEDQDEDEEEDPERDLEALYEQKETSLGDLSSKSSQISNVSDSSEECNISLTNSPEALKTRTVDIERTDSGVGSESSQASSGRGGLGRRWRTGAHNSCASSISTGNVSCAVGASNATGASAMAVAVAGTMLPSKPDPKLCEDCEQKLEPLIIDSSCVYSPTVCRKCSKKRAERKEIVTEIVETEQKYGRDLHIILEEFHRPMQSAGLLTQEQLSAIFLNVEELLEHNQILAEKLKDAVELAQESGDDDLVTVDFGKIFLESERMLHAFESYCTRQGGASLLLQNLEKEKELLRIFLKVSQMDNTVLRRMNLNSFLMVPVQRVTKYPLLLARLLKATPSGKSEMQELKKRLKQAQTNIELHLEHMNAEAKDITSTKLWRRISIIQNGRRSTGEQDMVNIKLRKMAVEVLEWAHEDSRFVLEGRLLVAQPTDNNWRRGRTVKLAPVTAMLVTNGKPNAEFLDFSDDSLFPRYTGIKEATLLLVKEKLGRYSLLREPLYLDKCIVCCETDLEDYFEVQELSSKETFIFKAEDGARTKRWCRTLQTHAQSLGAWRRRRGALPNIMICGVTRN